jgi:hypothetical protein
MLLAVVMSVFFPKSAVGATAPAGRGGANYGFFLFQNYTKTAHFCIFEPANAPLLPKRGVKHFQQQTKRIQ